MSIFDPTTDLQRGVTYTATVSASANDVGPMAAPAAVVLHHSAERRSPGVCPCSLFNDDDAPVVTAANDPGNVELGVAFSADTDGQVTGVRFYKGPGNTGAHTVSLWDTAGTQLATAPVTNESTTGWQDGELRGTGIGDCGSDLYRVYRAPVGRYSYTIDGLRIPIDKSPLHTADNASRYTYGSGAPTNTSTANYFVDPVFTVAPGAAPTVTSVSPADQSTSVPVTTIVGVTFDNRFSQARHGFAHRQRGNSGVRERWLLCLWAQCQLHPRRIPSPGTTYTVTVDGAKNLGGTPMAAPFVTTFTTSGPTVCPCSLLSSSATPAVSDSGDASPITVGLQFTADVDGVIAGIRYYRDAANTGEHTGTLYTSAGTALPP